MQVYKAFFKNLQKNLPTIIIYFIIFGVISILFAHFSSSDDEKKSFKSSKLNIAVFDYDNTELSNALYEYIDSTQIINNTIKDNENEIAEAMFNRSIDYILRIPAGFSEGLKENKENIVQNTPQPGSLVATMIDSQIQAYLKTLRIYISAGYSDEAAIKLTADTASAEASVTMHITPGKSADRDGNAFYFQYLTYIFICIMIGSLGSVLIIFHKKDLNSRIQCSSLSTTSRNIQLALGSITFAIAIWLLFMLMSLAFNGLYLFSTKGLLYMFNSFVFMIVATSLAYLISYFAKSISALSMYGSVLGLGMCFLCGIFVPIDFLSNSVIAVAKFLPAYWYIQAQNVIESFNNSSAELIKFFQYTGIEFLFAIVFLSCALAVSKFSKK